MAPKSIKDLNQLFFKTGFTLRDTEGKSLNISWYFDKLGDGSINNWNEISSNTKINTEGVIENGRVIEKMRCKFTDGALKQAKYTSVIPELEEKTIIVVTTGRKIC